MGYGRPLWGADILLCTTSTHIRKVRNVVLCSNKCDSLCFQFIKLILRISYLLCTIFCADIFNIHLKK